MKNSDTDTKGSSKDIKISDMGAKIPSAMKKGRGVGMKKLIFALLALVIILGATTFYFYRTSRVAKTDSIIDQKETEMLVKKVGEHIVLPTDEVPKIATVSDPEALKGQTFFDGAQRGDKVLIYTNAKRAVLYNPELDKIVNVAPLNTTAGSAPTPTPVTDPDSTPKKTEF